MMDLNRIRQLMPREELLAQLAEECDELGHAALKLRRAITGKNPTPVTEDEATEMILEETADLELCLMVLEYDRPLPAGKIKMYIERKADRWLRRLEENRKEE